MVQLRLSACAGEINCFANATLYMASRMTSAFPAPAACRNDRNGLDSAGPAGQDPGQFAPRKLPKLLHSQNIGKPCETQQFGLGSGSARANRARTGDTEAESPSWPSPIGRGRKSYFCQ